MSDKPTPPDDSGSQRPRPAIPPFRGGGGAGQGASPFRPAADASRLTRPPFVPPARSPGFASGRPAGTTSPPSPSPAQPDRPPAPTIPTTPTPPTPPSVTPPTPPRDPGRSPGPGQQPTEVPKEVPPLPTLTGTSSGQHDSVASEPIKIPLTEQDEPELTWLSPTTSESPAVNAIESFPEFPPIPPLPSVPPFEGRMSPPTPWDAVRAVDPLPGAARRPEPPVPGYRSGEFAAIPRRPSGERAAEAGAPAGGAIELAQCLEDLARRIRAGEVAAPSYRPGMKAEGALAALLAALLDHRE